MHERFIARQPIFDSRIKVFAYELLFRGGKRNVFEQQKNASQSVIVNSTMLFDLQTLTGFAKAFINADDSSLLSGAPRLLPADRIVVEILETVEPTPEIVQAVKELSSAGYVFALDDFVDKPKWAPLIGFAKYLKVDFRACDQDARRAIAQRYRQKGMELLAEKVETEVEVNQARELGYCYFQGFFFSKPTMIEGREIPGNKLNYLRLIQSVAVPEFNFEAVEEVLKQEPALVYKLLRYLNSPLLGTRSEIRSIRDGIQLLGETEFRRWVSIVAVVALAADKPPELVRTALTRAYFCEEISHPIGLTQQKSDLFLMGLLSVADALLDRPMDQILTHLPVSNEVRTALSGGDNAFRAVYDTLLSYERADWNHLNSAIERLGRLEEQIPICYLAAANRAGSISV